MKTIRIIKDLLNEEAIRCEFIPSGLTNKNTKVTLREKTVVLREPKKENAHLFDYKLEHKILEHVTSLDTPLIYFDPNSGTKISEFIENASTFQTEYTPNAARLIKSLHELPFRSGVIYNIIETFQKYTTANPRHNLSPYTHYLEAAHLSSGPYVLCHNDLVEGNFLFTSERDYLIDYEYACDNDPYFDLMSFITENDIQDRPTREVFYHTYFGKAPTQAQRDKLKIFEAALHVLWCQWACMMFEQSGEPVYRDIADLKYKRLIELQ